MAFYGWIIDKGFILVCRRAECGDAEPSLGRTTEILSLDEGQFIRFCSALGEVGQVDGRRERLS